MHDFDEVFDTMNIKAPKLNMRLLILILFLIITEISTLKAFEMLNIKIEPIQSCHIQAVKKIILEAAFELQIIPSTSVEEIERFCDRTGELDDLYNIPAVYDNQRGIFLVMLHGDKVIGMGALKQINKKVCELKRMFFAKEYRGKGLGTLMTQKLIDQAKELGYKKIVLEVYNPSTSVGAVALYKKLGFYETSTSTFKDGSGHLFMEKIL